MANLVKYNQKIFNGDFSQGANGWNFNGGNATFDNDGLTLTSDATQSAVDLRCEQKTPIRLSQGDKIYIHSEILASNGGTAFIHRLDPSLQWAYTLAGNQSFRVDSQIFTVNSDTTSILHFFNFTAGNVGIGYYYKIKSLIIINLTEMYGAGYEPTTVAEVEADLLEIGKSGYQPKNDGEFIPISKQTGYTGWNVSYSTEHGTAPDSKYVENGYALTSEDLPTLSEAGWYFNGWNKQVGDTITDNTVITASWAKRFSGMALRRR